MIVRVLVITKDLERGKDLAGVSSLLTIMQIEWWYLMLTQALLNFFLSVNNFEYVIIITDFR